MPMQSEPTEQQRRDYLAGETSVVWAMIAALIHTHPDIRALNAAFYQCAELQFANELMGNVSEAFEKGQASGRNRMATLLTATLKLHGY